MRNHIGTLHAIVLCNGAELVAGVVTDILIPATSRWISTKMSVEYLAMAKTDITIKTRAENLDWTAIRDIVVPVEAFATSNKLAKKLQRKMG